MLNARELELCVDRFGTDIYRFCLKMCTDRQDAEDLYQQTFLKAMEKEWTLDWGQNPRALFFSLAHYIWKSSKRKSAMRASIAPCSNLEEEQTNLLRAEGSPEEDYLREELFFEVNRLIEALPEKIRVPITLYYLFELPIEEIAQILEKPAGTIKSRLFKGRKIIKKGLEESGYGI